MNKQEFLTALWKQLSEVPSEDVEESLDYYSEMIEDRMESGMTEEEAVAAVGSVEDAAKQIIAEIPEELVGTDMPLYLIIKLPKDTETEYYIQLQ